MTAERNIELIKRVYASFQKGDLPGILEALSDDVDWGIEAAASRSSLHSTDPTASGNSLQRSRPSRSARSRPNMRAAAGKMPMRIDELGGIVVVAEIFPEL